MPVARFEMPDGRVARFEVPDGITPEQAQSMIEREFPNLVAQSPKAAKQDAPRQPRGFIENLKAVATSPASNPMSMIADTAPDWLKRQVGLTGRAAAEGITAIPNMIGDALGLRSTQTVRDWLTKFGVPLPENATERVAQDVAGAMSVGGGIQGVGSGMARATGPVTSRIGELLTSQRGLQAVSAATGAGSAGVARESGVGPGGQVVAGLVGGLAPTVAPGAASSVRGLLRGGEAGRARTAENIRTFEKAGYGTPSVGQATEGRFARAAESTLAKAPGGAAPIAKAAEKGQAALKQRVDEIADAIKPGATATKAGAAIERGVKSFVDRFRGEQNFLYDKLDNYIAKDRPIDMTNTANRLAELNADIPGAPALSKFFKNSTIQSIESALKSDTGDLTKRLPYEALKKLRTLVGSELENASIVSTVPRSKWKSLYAAISDDLLEAANEAGPEAQKAFARANTYSRAGYGRIETYLDRIAGKGTVEKVFTAAVSPSEIKEGASTINAVMRSIPKADRDMVRSAFIKRLGHAQAGQQGAAGEAFSSETFLTNWNKISPEAKMTLFADQAGTLRNDLDKIANVAANIREGSRVFANPSGTQQAISTQFAGAWTLFSVLTGNFGIAATIGGAVLGANQSAKLMTNPQFVKWLAQSTTAPVGAIPGQLATLATISKNMPEEDRVAVQDYIGAVSQKLEQAGTQGPQPQGQAQ